MALPEERQDHQGRVDIFHPNSLTHEEAELLRKLRFESSWKRGYPLAIICGSVVAFGTKRFSMPARIALSCASGMMGNVVGKISYLPTIYSRLMSDLPESSPLRQKLEQMKKEGPNAFAENFQNKQHSDHNEDHGLQFSTGSESGSHDMEPFDTQAGETKKFVTYEELRERNRKGVSVPVPSKNDEFGSFGQLLNTPSQDSTVDPVSESEISVPAPKKDVRYNKYGDPIIE